VRRLSIPLNDPVVDKLLALAKSERRRPQDQAAYLLEKALRELEQRREPKEVTQCDN